MTAGGLSHPGRPDQWCAGIPMRGTTIRLNDDLDARLRHAAKRRGTTIADVARDALAAHLDVGARRKLGAAGFPRPTASAPVPEPAKTAVDGQLPHGRPRALIGAGYVRSAGTSVRVGTCR
ncbi:MAG: ribbon-helix-helix protein, CopG family [Solirubrobacteraceae bacterium]